MSQHFHAETRTARKPHRCELCHRTIDPGETYRHGAGMDGATAWTWNECAHCDVVRQVAFQHYGDSEYGSDLIDEWEPETVAQLRVKAQWKRRWRHKDGTLMPIPTLITEEVTYVNGMLIRTVIRDVRAGERLSVGSRAGGAA